MMTTISKTTTLSVAVTSKLRPHQIQPTEDLCRILRQFDSAVDWSDTGTGKTYVAVATAIQLGLPCLAVVPKISITSWHRAAEHFGDKLSVINYESLRTGHTPYGKWEHQDQVDAPREKVHTCVVCFQKLSELPCPHHPAGIHCVSTKSKAVKYGAFKFHPGVKLLIFDEAHRCNGLDSLNADLLIASKKIKTLLLSATAAVSPLHFSALGHSLDLHRGGSDFYRWSARHGCQRHPAFRGWVWLVGQDRQRSVMAQIRSQVIPARGVRVTTDQIPNFPERDVTAELYDLENPKIVDRIYRDMQDALGVLAGKSHSEHPLTVQLRARQKIELLKVPVAVEVAQDALEKGFSVGVFVNFRQTAEELSRLLKCPVIDGTVTGEARQRIIDDFQANKIRCIVLNIAAGGICISLQDLFGGFARMGLVMPSFSAEQMLQVFGRFHREGGKSKCFYKVLLAAGTLETAIFRAFQLKRNNIGALNDGDLLPEGIQLSFAV